MATAADGYIDRYYSAPDGLRLHARVYGETIPGPDAIVCLPGLTRNARDFHELALHLSASAKTPRRVVAFDYRGRGLSDYDPDWKKYDVGVEAADVLAGMVALDVAAGWFVGTSRGGLIVHVLAAMRPTVLKAVVLNDIGPVVEGEGLAHIRSYLERAPKPGSIEDAVAIQRAVHGAAFPALTDADWRRFVAAIYREEDGVPVADFDPALLNGLRSFDLSKPLPQLWQQFEGLAAIPMLAIRGENSKLLSAETLSEMAKRHPACETVTVSGQGHAPLLETAGLPARIAAFLDRADAER